MANVTLSISARSYGLGIGIAVAKALRFFGASEDLALRAAKCCVLVKTHVTGQRRPTWIWMARS